MPVRLAIWLSALAAAAVPAAAAKLDGEACRRIRAEHEGLVATGVRGDMGRGPDWAKANLPPERLERIKRWLTLEEDLRFKCNEVRPTTLKPGGEDPEDGEATKPAPAAAPAPAPAQRRRAAQPAQPAAQPPAAAAAPAQPAPAADPAPLPAAQPKPKPAATPTQQ
jgi:hypothetical protein